MVNGWRNKSTAYLKQLLPIPSFLILVIIFLSSTGFSYYNKEAAAQVPVQVQEKEPKVQVATLKLGGQDCDVNKAESAVLHLEGIKLVDIERKPGFLIVTYDPEKVHFNEMLAAVGEKKGEEWFCTATAVSLSQ